MLSALGTAVLAADGMPAEDDATMLIQVTQVSMGVGHRHTVDTDFEELFRNFDEDKNGSLNMVELSAYLKKHYSQTATPAQARKIMRRSDMNADFSLDLDEFLGCASDVTACETSSPQLPKAATKTAVEASSVQALSNGLSSLDLSLTDFLPDEWSSALKQTQVERCTERDRDIMKGEGLSVDGQEGAGKPDIDSALTQLVQIRGTWVTTLLMPESCRAGFAHAGRVDRPKHAACLQESLNITHPCARCNTNFFYNMVHNCAVACSASMSSKPCVDCTRPEKLLECVEGKGRWSMAAARCSSLALTPSLLSPSL